MKKVFWALFVFSLFVLGSTSVVAQLLQPLSLDTQIRSGKLENGLSYYIQYNKELVGRANFSLVRNAGTLFENEAQGGFTDLLAYLAFKGSKNFPGNSLSSYFEEIGLRFGNDISVYSSPDELVYSIKELPTARIGTIDTTLLLFHDCLAYLQFEDRDINDARYAVLERQQINESASSSLQNELNRLKFTGSRYAKKSTVCDTTFFLNFYPQALRNFYRAGSSPEWHAVVVVGDVDVDVLEGKIREAFQSIPMSWGALVEDAIDDNDEPIVAIVSDSEALVSSLSVDYKQNAMTPDLKSSVNGYLVSTINKLIVSMVDDRLFEIVNDSVAPFVAASSKYANLLKSKDAFSLRAVSQEGLELKSFEVLMSEAEKIKRFGFLSAELERAKAVFFKDIERQYNERDKRSNSDLTRACIDHFSHADALPGIEWEYRSLQVILPQISVEMVNKIAESYISDKNIIISLSAPSKPGLLLPAKEEFLEALQNVKMAELDTIEESTPKDLPALMFVKPGRIKRERVNEQLGVSEWVLSNGINLVFKPTTFKNDEILMRVFSSGGLSQIANLGDLPSAMFASKLISKSGMGNLTKIELERALAGKRVVLEPFISEYSEGFSAHSSVNDFETLLQLTNLYFTAPLQDDNAFAVSKNSCRAELLNRANDASLVFSDTLQSILNAYSSRIPVFNLEMLDSVKLNRAFEIYKERLAEPADFTFVFVGNIRPEDEKIKELILTYLGSLKSQKRKEKYTHRAAPMFTGRVSKTLEHKMNYPKAVTEVVFSSNISYGLKNYVLMDALQVILTLRYDDIVRDKMQAGSKMTVKTVLQKSPLEQAVLNISIVSNAQKQQRLSKIVESEIYKLIAYGLGDDDLLRVKNTLLKNYEAQINDNSWWAEYLVDHYENRIAFSAEYEAEVRALNDEQIKTVLKKIVMSGNKIELSLTPKED